MINKQMIQCYNPKFEEKILFLWNKYFHDIPLNYNKICSMLSSNTVQSDGGWSDADDYTYLSKYNENNPQNKCCKKYIEYIKNLYAEKKSEYYILYTNLNIINKHADTIYKKKLDKYNQKNYANYVMGKNIKENVPYLLKEICKIISKL